MNETDYDEILIDLYNYCVKLLNSMITKIGVKLSIANVKVLGFLLGNLSMHASRAKIFQNKTEYIDIIQVPQPSIPVPF